MINHVRTLLHNVAAHDASDEYIDPDFVPVTKLPQAVDAVYHALIAHHEDANLVVRQLLQMLHATELEEHVLVYDPRVTYLPFDDLHFGKALHDLGDMLQVIEPVVAACDPAELFGDVTVEPAKTYYNLWTRHDQLPYKLGGLVLAIAAAIERAR